MDDLLDLDWQKSTSASSFNQTASSRQPPHPTANSVTQSSQYSSYNFDALTRSMPTTASSPSPPIPRPQAATKTKAGPDSNAADDAFSSLLSSFGTGSSSSSATSTSMADRQKASQLNKLSQPALAATKKDDTWSSGADWGALEAGSQNQQLSGSRVAASNEDPFTVFEALTASEGQPRIPKRPEAQGAQIHKQTPRDPFDFSFDDDPGQDQSSAFDAGPQSKSTLSLTNLDSDSDDDFLGALGQPVKQKLDRPTQGKASSSSPSPNTNSRPPSPPPHLLGRIVEMGFSPAEARKALARTASGLDVDAALEELLHGGQRSSDAQEEEDRRLAQRLQREEGRDAEMEEYEERERQRRAARRGKQSMPAASRRGGLTAPSTSTPIGRHSTLNGSATAAGEDDFDWQRQADQLYNQASELGASVFTKANAFWSSAKAQAQKTLEERQTASGATSGRATPSNNVESGGSGRASPTVDGMAAAKAWARRWGVSTPKPSERKEWEGKPKWMIDAELAENVAKTAEGATPEPSAAGEAEGFRDSDTEDDPAPSFIPPAIREQEGRKESLARRETKVGSADVWDEAPAALFKASANSNKDDAVAKPYVSSARWGNSRSNVSSSTVSGTNKTTGGEGSAVVTKTVRSLCPEDLAPLDSSASALKSRGNESFRKGAYGEAEAAYSGALERITERSLRRIPLLNNRSTARLKNGDAPAANRDAAAVLLLICPKGETMYEPSKEEALPSALSMEVNLREAYSKALLRRGQANEMLEKWVAALRDWTLLEKYEKEQGSGSATGFRNLKSAQDGIRRCKSIMAGDRKDGNGGSTTASPRSTPAARRATASRQAAKAAATSAVSKAEQAGRERVRAANAAQAAEEAAAASLKDSIDARVNAWKAGKETNVRALLSSLENVVWSELGWKKVGMHEVVTDVQVKKAYTRAMIKLHPDKLTPQTTTLENRLIGSAVFAVLNEAFAVSTNK